VVAARKEANAQQVEAIQTKQRAQMPVFYMRGAASKPGHAVQLHFFEPRYRILIRRAWEGSKRFLCVQAEPKAGDVGLIVEVDLASFLPDGRANIRGRGVELVTLSRAWVESGTAGLFYAEVEGVKGTAAASARPPAVASTNNAEVRARATLRAVISQGVPAYNRGDVQRCVVLYRAAAELCLIELASEGPAASRLQRGLREAEQASSQASRTIDAAQARTAAWALRHSFDDVLASPPPPRSQASGSSGGPEVDVTREVELPVFVSSSAVCPDVGERVRINFFEPRYKVMSREVWGTRARLFLFSASPPEEGGSATLVRLEACEWEEDGLATITTVSGGMLRLGAVREDAAKGGLFYAQQQISSQFLLGRASAPNVPGPCCVAQ
ncbi:unnamed protein product, partial [Polarella glacialis]